MLEIKVHALYVKMVLKMLQIKVDALYVKMVLKGGEMLEIAGI